MVESVSAEHAREQLASEPETPVIDTRPAEDYAEWHLPEAINVPFSTSDELSQVTLPEGFPDEDESFFTVCAYGISSVEFADQLSGAGYEEVVSIDGGMAAWSNLYDVVPIELGGEVHCTQIQRTVKGCMGYFVGSVRTNEVIVVDPPRHVETVAAELERRADDPIAVVDTHVHADHVSGGPALATRFGLPYHVGHVPSERQLHHDATPLGGGETLEVGGLDIEVRSVPGHTAGSVALEIPSCGIITGDTLFTDSVGRTELEDPDAAVDRARDLYATLQDRILGHDGSMLVLPGHFEPTGATVRSEPTPQVTTIRDARERIDLLSLHRDAFVDRVVDRSATRPPNYRRIIGINLGVEEVPDEDTLTTLELGPNRCAAPS